MPAWSIGLVWYSRNSFYFLRTLHYFRPPKSDFVAKITAPQPTLRRVSSDDASCRCERTGPVREGRDDSACEDGYYHGLNSLAFGERQPGIEVHPNRWFVCPPIRSQMCLGIIR